MLLTFEYPVVLQAEDTGFSVLFPDLPEAITQGDTLDEALDAAADALEEAIANRIVMQMDLPAPSGGEQRIALRASTATEAAFYVTIRSLGLSKVELAATLGVDEREVRRLLDPYHPSKLNRIEELLAKLDKQFIVAVRDVKR